MDELLARLPEYGLAHLRLALLALAVATVVSLPLGVVASRVAWAERAVLGIASVIQTIPGLALLAVMVPLLGAIGLPSIGVLPAAIALCLYGVLPILRNVVTGIAGVDPAVREAARAVGMTPRQALRLVELPLAAPVIVAGVRTAAVWLVGMATLSTPVGAPSLGNYIFAGLQTRSYDSVLVGCVAAAALALVLDGLVRALESGVRERRPVRTRASAVALAALVLVAAGSAVGFGFGGARGAGPNASGATITIGAKTFTESYVLAEILAAHVARETPHRTRTLTSMGSTVVYDALRQGEIDAYVDYSGTLWTTVLRREGEIPARDQMLDALARELESRDGVILVGALGFENAYALAMRGEDARRLGLRRISDLREHASQLAFGGDYEWFQRAEWRAIERLYGIHPREQRPMDPSLMYQAIEGGDVDVISAYTTDGRIPALGLVVLEDDRDAIPPYDAVILASARLRREQPDVLDALRALTDRIDATTMSRLNMEVDRDHRTPAQVAESFLRR